jgi:hypothetical protein
MSIGAASIAARTSSRLANFVMVKLEIWGKNAIDDQRMKFYPLMLRSPSSPASTQAHKHCLYDNL